VSLRDQLATALKDAMRAKDQRRVSTLRLILAAIKDRDISMRTEADERDDDVIVTEILGRMVKQRRESMTAYEEGGRLELAEQEREEIAIIEEFLPRQLSAGEAEEACRNAIAETGAASLKDIGKVMAVLKERYAGRMDFAAASREVKRILSNEG